MAKSLLDRVLAFMGIQEELDDPEEDEATSAPTTPMRAEPPRTASAGAGDELRRPRLVSLPNQKAAGSLKVMVLAPHTFEEVQAIADYLKERRPVIVSLESVDRELSKRIVDFVSGTTYALDGSVQRIGEGIFLFTPSNVSIEGDLAERWRDGGIFA